MRAHAESSRPLALSLYLSLSTSNFFLHTIITNISRAAANPPTRRQTASHIARRQKFDELYFFIKRNTLFTRSPGRSEGPSAWAIAAREEAEAEAARRLRR